MCEWNEFQKTFYFMTIFVTNVHIVSYNSITSQVGAIVVVGFITTCTYVITTNVVSLNPAQAMCTRYNHV
jgi:hypothetical protein